MHRAIPLVNAFRSAIRAIFSPVCRPVLGVQFWSSLCTRVGGCLEPNPRAARPRAARARSGHSPASGEIQEKIRGRHQSRQRADGAGRRSAVAVVSRTSCSSRRTRAASCWRGRGGDRRVGEQPRGDVAVGGVLEAARAVPPLRAARIDRHGAALLRRPADSGGGDLGVPIASAIRFGSRWCSDPPGGDSKTSARRPAGKSRVRARPAGAGATPAAPARPACGTRRAPRGCITHASANGGRPLRPHVRRPRRALRARRNGARRRQPQDAAATAPMPPPKRSRRPAKQRKDQPRARRGRRSAGRRPCRSFASSATSAGTKPRYLMHWYREGTRQRSRILYMFRTPGGVRVGRDSRSSRTFFAQLEAAASRHRLRLEGGSRQPAGRRAGARLPPATPAPRRGRGRDAEAPPAGAAPVDAAPAARVGRRRRRRTVAARRRSRPRSKAPRPTSRSPSSRNWYPSIRERIPQRTADPARQEALLALAERLNPAAWTDADQITRACSRRRKRSSGCRACLRRRRRRARRSPADRRPAPRGRSRILAEDSHRILGPTTPNA